MAHDHAGQQQAATSATPVEPQNHVLFVGGLVVFPVVFIMGLIIVGFAIR